MSRLTGDNDSSINTIDMARSMNFGPPTPKQKNKSKKFDIEKMTAMKYFELVDADRLACSSTFGNNERGAPLYSQGYSKPNPNASKLLTENNLRNSDIYGMRYSDY